MAPFVSKHLMYIFIFISLLVSYVVFSNICLLVFFLCFVGIEFCKCKVVCQHLNYN
jgi:hypothetical protein